MRACVAGLGQRAAGDDGVGLAVVEALVEGAVPEGVDVRALGDSSELVELFGEVDRLILVDAVLDGLPAGTVRVIDADALDRASSSAVSSHGIGVGQALALGRVLHPNARPEVRVIAISTNPPSCYAEGLSGAVARAVPEAVSQVLAELGAP